MPTLHTESGGELPSAVPSQDLPAGRLRIRACATNPGFLE